MMKKLLLAAFLTTALFSGLNYSIYAQAANAVELETLNQGQVKNIIRVNSENELPKDGTTYTLVYSKQHCKLPDEPEKTTGTSQNTTTATTSTSTSQDTTTTTASTSTSQEVTTASSSTTETHNTTTSSTVVTNPVVPTTNSSTTEANNTTTTSMNEATQKKTTESAPQTTSALTSVLKAQVKQSLPQTGTQKSVAVVLTAGVLVALAFLMIKYHKKKVWMVLLITASVTSLYNLRNVMAQNETKVTTIPVTTFIPTSDHCLYGYIIIPKNSETTKSETSKGEPLVFEKPEFKGGVPGMPEVHENPEFNGGVVPNEAPIHDKPSIEVTMEEPIFESSSVETTAGTSTEPETEPEPTTTTEFEPTTAEASANN